MTIHPQAGIFREGNRYHHFLEYVLSPGAAKSLLADACAAARAGRGDGPAVVVAFGARLWGEIAPDDTPEGLRDFAAIEGAGDLLAPATQRDLLFWVQGEGRDDVLDRALALQRALGTAARLELDLAGFTYHDSRDLTGFIDGTANPKDGERHDVALVPQGRPGAGGAFVLSQKWVHDLEAFGALSVAEQERVIGRTKADSIELEGAAMPADSHVSRTDVSLDGVAQKIYRRSTPFGGVGEHGLYFLAFARELSRFEVQLRHMFGVSEDGLHDRLMAFSRARTGSYWFAPSEDALTRLGKE
ncbi:MAG: Dyp-type peroxidase [Alphaproteobacteria bacterium]